MNNTDTNTLTQQIQAVQTALAVADEAEVRFALNATLDALKADLKEGSR